MEQPFSPFTRGAIGFGASLSFLLFVNKFNSLIASLKAKRHITKTSSSQKQDLFPILYSIFARSCSIREVYTFLGLSTCLILRTFGSVWVSRHWGKVVSAIVQRKFELLKELIVKFAMVTVGLAFLNAGLKYFISLMSQHVREKITIWVHSEYMKEQDMIYYKANKVGERKLDNCDHRITSDIEKFSDLFATVLSQSLKPVVDFVVYSVELSRAQGLATPLTLYSWFALASALSTFITL